MPRAVCVLVYLCAAAVPAVGQESVAALPAPVAVAEAAAPAYESEVPLPIAAPKRPSSLVPLYGAFAGLQAADYLSTTRALGSGVGVEANPVMKPVAENRAAFLAVKAASTAGMIWASERLWKRHRVAAVFFMVGANATMAVVVAHNARVLSSVR